MSGNGNLLQKLVKSPWKSEGNERTFGNYIPHQGLCRGMFHSLLVFVMYNFDQKLLVPYKSKMESFKRLA